MVVHRRAVGLQTRESAYGLCEWFMVAPDSHQADLNALSKLYGLVQINESGGQSLLTKILDEDSSIFLKKLRDSAVERIFEAHVEYMIDKWRSALYTKNLGQPEDPLEICNNALARVESLIPSLQDLSKPYSVALASSSGQTSGVRTSITIKCNTIKEGIKRNTHQEGRQVLEEAVI